MAILADARFEDISLGSTIAETRLIQSELANRQSMIRTTQNRNLATRQALIPRCQRYSAFRARAI